MNLVLIPLQPNEPPARDAHAQTDCRAAQDYANDAHDVSATADGHAQTARGQRNQEAGQEKVAVPAVMSQMTSEDREQAEDLDAEQRQTKYVRRCG